MRMSHAAYPSSNCQGDWHNNSFLDLLILELNDVIRQNWHIFNGKAPFQESNRASCKKVWKTGDVKTLGRDQVSGLETMLSCQTIALARYHLFQLHPKSTLPVHKLWITIKTKWKQVILSKATMWSIGRFYTVPQFAIGIYKSRYQIINALALKSQVIFRQMANGRAEQDLQMETNSTDMNFVDWQQTIFFKMHIIYLPNDANQLPGLPFPYLVRHGIKNV